eukprot:9468313-Pyramimonas_sp.AAC.2
MTESVRVPLIAAVYNSRVPILAASEPTSVAAYPGDFGAFNSRASERTRGMTNVTDIEVTLRQLRSGYASPQLLSSVGRRASTGIEVLWNYLAAAEVGVGLLGAGGVGDVHRLNGEGLFAVAREHGDHCVEHDASLVQVGGSALDEDVLGVERDGGVRAVDDGGEGEHGAVGVVDDRGDKGTQLEVRLVELEEVLRVELLRLLERGELDVLPGERLVREGALDGAQVVRANGNQGPLPADVLMQLVLQVDKAVVACLHCNVIDVDVIIMDFQGSEISVEHADSLW